MGNEFNIYMYSHDEKVDEDGKLIFSKEDYYNINMAITGKMVSGFSFDDLRKIVKEVQVLAHKDNIKLFYPPKFKELVRIALGV